MFFLLLLCRGANWNHLFLCVKKFFFKKSKESFPTLVERVHVQVRHKNINVIKELLVYF